MGLALSVLGQANIQQQVEGQRLTEALNKRASDIVRFLRSSEETRTGLDGWSQRDQRSTANSRHGEL